MHLPQSTSSRRVLLGGVLAASLGAAAGAAGPAAADMLAYTSGKDVWVENADGTMRKQLTTDGAEGTYVTPSPNDAGDVTAVRLAGWTAFIHVLPAGGGEPTVNTMPTRGTGALVGPFSGRMIPDSASKLYAYTYARSDPWGGMRGPYFNVVPANAPGSPGGDAGIDGGVFRATPHADKHVYAALNGKLYYGLGGSQDPVLLELGGEGAKLDYGEVSRDGTKLLATASGGGGSVLALIRLAGAMPGTPDGDCVIDTTGSVPRAALSPDGDRAAWKDDAGLHVARIELADGKCAVSEKRTIAQDGDYPAFSRHTMSSGSPAPVHGASGGDQQTTTPIARAQTPQTGTRGARTGGTLALDVKGAPLLRALRKGLPVTVRGATGAVRVTATLPAAAARRARLGRRATVVGTGRATASGEATVVRVRFTKAAVRRLRRMRSVKLQIGVVGAGTQRTVTLKR